MLRPGDPGDGRRRPHSAAEALGEGERDAVVAAGDPVTREVAEAGGSLRERCRVLVLELVRGRDGEPRGNGGACAGRGHEPLERVGDRPGSRIPQRLVRRDQLLARHGRAVAGLAVAVQRALLVELEPEPCSGLAQDVVAGKHELRPELDDGAVVEPPGVDASSDAVARLEDDHLGAAGGERIGGGETGEAGSDDDDATDGQAPRGSAR